MIPSSLAQQWPFLAVMAMAIVALFGIVLKLNDSRIGDLKTSYDEQIATLKGSYDRLIADLRERNQALAGEVEAWRAIAFSGTTLAERATGTLQEVAHAPAPPAAPAKPSAVAQAAQRLTGRRLR